jgi:hypothetical protein
LKTGFLKKEEEKNLAASPQTWHNGIPLLHVVFLDIMFFDNAFIGNVVKGIVSKLTIKNF